jgi:hypothetical protein
MLVVLSHLEQRERLQLTQYLPRLEISLGIHIWFLATVTNGIERDRLES